MKSWMATLAEIEIPLREANRILIASDFDGTLCPIADTPSEVHVAPATFEVLRKVIGNPRLTLAVISGRALVDVRRRLPLEMIIAGNHGLEIGGACPNFEHAEARHLRPTLTAACAALREIQNEWPAAWVEDKGLSATLHFRGVEQRHRQAVRFAARARLGAFGAKLALRAGKQALEVRPKVYWDKGSALHYIRQKVGPFQLCVCIGDDRTDEAMFRANPDGVNIRVGSAAQTAALHILSDSAAVAILLSHIAQICEMKIVRERSLLRSSSAPTSSARAGG